MALCSWLSSSLVRNYPSTPSLIKRNLSFDVARNERFSFQLVLRNEAKVDFEAKNDTPQLLSIEASAPQGWNIRIRRVGYIPVLHRNTRTAFEDIEGAGNIPGYVPDPLFDENSITLPANETHAFWFSVVPSIKSRPGTHIVNITIAMLDGTKRTHTVKIKTHDFIIKKRKNFFVTNWFYNDALFDFHDCQPFDEAYWKILPEYFRNMVDHGQDTILIPVFTPPLDGVKRPTQLLHVTVNKKGVYKFDWTDVKRYVQTAKKAGFINFEWSHLFTQWGARNAIRIYEQQGLTEKLLWPPETLATSKIYRNFLEQFLPAFYSFLKNERLLSRSYFHLSDEPHGEEHLANYKKARDILRELASWMKVTDALSQIEFGRQKLTDHPIPIINTALDFIKENISCSCYFCCWPRGKYLNRLLDTPLASIRMSGWLFYRWPFHGFLHWGYNYWYQSQTRKMIDPYIVQDGLKWPNWAYGDCFVVYPGKNGPIDSIRWEVFAESLQDYAMLQTAKIKPDSLKEFKSFESYPKSSNWLIKKRKRIFIA
jgi:hypothetical protein